MATENSVNSSTPLSVSAGGTGEATLTNHGLLVGAGTSPVTSLAVGADHSVLIGATGADPAFTTSGTVYASGISFDAGSNILSSYATTTWTPSIAFGGGTTGITYTTQTGTYYKIGGLVFLFFDVLLSSKGSSTGNATFEGLPFNRNAGPAAGYAVLYSNITLSQATLECNVSIYPNTSGNNGVLKAFVGTTSHAAYLLTDVEFANTSRIYGQIFYNI